MKRWAETAAVWRGASEAAAAGRPAALATLFALDGSGYRRAGAKMLIEPGGATLGGVSAGCVEADLVERARPILDGAPAELVEYATGGEDEPPWGLRTGCSGTLRVLLQRVSPVPPEVELHAIVARLAGTVPFAVVTRTGEAPRHLVVGDDADLAGSLGDDGSDRIFAVRARRWIERGRPGVHRAGEKEYVEVLHPPPRLTIVGGGHQASSLARLAVEVGFLVRVVDHRPEALEPIGDPRVVIESARPGDPWRWETPDERTFVVLQTHALDHDRAWVRAILAAGRPAYLGVLGSRDRVREVAAAAPPDAGYRIHGPVGLDIGAEGPEQIAVSVVAEVLAVWSGRDGGHLRNGAGSLHAVFAS